MVKYIKLEDKRFPVRDLWVNNRCTLIRVSTENLNMIILDSSGNYSSTKARLIDEGIFFYIPEHLLVKGTDEEVEQFVHKHL